MRPEKDLKVEGRPSEVHSELSSEKDNEDFQPFRFARRKLQVFITKLSDRKF